MDLTYHSGASALPALADRVLTLGEEVKPRGMRTRELTDVTVRITDPTDVLLHGCNRARYHPVIGVVEGLCLVGGVSDPPLLRRASAVFGQFQDGGALHGAYGPRLRPQLTRVQRTLQLDPDSRQAVAAIWDPAYDLQPETPPRDLPCTVYLLFRLRGGRLELKVHMRSNDLWRGWCYDVIQFTLLQNSVAAALGVLPGPYVHHVDSLHAYEADWDALRGVKGRPLGDDVIHLEGVTTGRPWDRPTPWRELRARALELLYSPDVRPESETERWLLDRLRRDLKGN